MMRVVFDTNIVVSAMLSRSGTAADVLRLALNHHVQLRASEVILEEYEEVLRRPKFRRPPQVVSALMKAVRAEAAKVDYLVTGNIRHFPAAWGRTRVITARQLIELVTPKL